MGGVHGGDDGFEGRQEPASGYGWFLAGGGEPIALTDENDSSSHPRWSPDGKYIAFFSAREGSGGDDDEEKGKKQVWILNREGGEAQQLTDTIQDVDSFAWSPGSDRMVLVLQDPTPEEIEAAENKSKGEQSENRSHGRG